MMSPDKFFDTYSSRFKANTRNQARKLFRRGIRDFYVMQRRFVIEPDTGKRVKSFLIGEVIQQQKRQRRKIVRHFKGQIPASQAKSFAIRRLVSRLFILWGTYANTPTTLSWKTTFGVRTNFEKFLYQLLPNLGARDVRRYVEHHWRERKQYQK